MEGALCAIFSGPSSSRKTAPMFAGLIERKARGAAATSSTGLPRTLRSKGGLKRHQQAYASCLQGAIRSAAAAASLTGRYRRPPMPQLGLGRAITLARLPFVTNGTPTRLS